MLQSMKTTHRGWKIVYSLIALILTANYLFIYEYMIGFEGARLALLGFVLFRDRLKSIGPLLRELLRRIWPYWVVTAGFLYWRLFIFEGARNATNAAKLAGTYLADLRHMSIRVIVETTKDFLSTTIFAWFVSPYQAFSTSTYTDLAMALLLAAAVAILVLLYTAIFKRRSGADYDEPEISRLMRQFLWLGAVVTVCAVAPVIASGRQVDLYDSYKSYGLHPIAGAILFVAGLLLMFQASFRRLILIGLIAVSVSTQILNADYWGRLWDYQREMWWQVTWRAPDIKDGTLAIAYLPDGYRLQQDYEIWGPLNLIYNPQPTSIPAIQSEVLTTDTAYDILKQDVLNNHDRDIKMHRDFNNLLLISMPTISTCIHVIDGSLPVYSEYDDLLVQQVGGYSHIDRIVTSGTAPVPPAPIFGSEPEHDWCYYYQKASLARQAGDWQEVGKLYDKTIALGLEARDTAELIPFFEGLVNLRRYDEARTLYNTQIKGREKLRFPLCNFLAKDPGYLPDFHYDYKMIYQILCNS